MSEWLHSLTFEQEQAFWTILIASLLNISCALVGCFLVLRRISMLGDAISHAVLPGIAFAYVLTQSLSPIAMLIGAGVFGLLTSVGTVMLQRFARISEDSSLGIVYTALFALGVIVIQVTPSAQNVHLDMDAVLEGAIEFAPLITFEWHGMDIPESIKMLVPLLAITLLVIGLFWKEWKLISFDPALATAMGFPAHTLHIIMMVLVTAVTVAGFHLVGSILVVAMLIVPAATAQLLSERMWSMLLWACLCGVISAWGGYTLAYQWNSSASGMMTVVAGLCYVTALVFSPKQGLLSQVIFRLRLRSRIMQEDILARLFRQEEWHKTHPDSKEAPAQISAPKEQLTKYLLWSLTRKKNLVRQGQTYVLSDSGRERARSLVRAHRLWESYLDQYFQIPTDHLHEPASTVEHYIGPALQKQLAEQIRDPESDPHGRNIPPAG
jgi:ABC-type Mn2+/Zn2+ transport system permease subunit